MAVRPQRGNPYASRLQAAREVAAAVSKSKAHDEFVEVVRKEAPWRFKGVKELDRYLHNVRHHLLHFAPLALSCVDDDIRTVFDFGCGSGSGSIALALIFPGLRCQGVDISPAEVAIGRERAKLFGVGDRCQFECIAPGQALPAPSDAFDLCTCCSVLEYVTDPDVRKFCIQEMARVLVPGGRLFMSVPNRLYPIELHSRKLGWNYFPKFLKARIVGTTAWEVMRLAHPHVLKLCSTPLRRLLTPWTNFCLRKER